MTSHFIWYELLTSDPDAAQRFYGSVVGWQAADSGQAGIDYRLLTIDGAGIGGLMALPPGAREAGMRPGWLGYVSVADVDATAARIVAAGGSSHMPPTDLPGVGRMAMLADPQGAALYIMAPTGPGQSTAFAPGQPGHVGWNELHARDSRAARDYYGALFGWRQVGEMPLGAEGAYRQFSYGAGEMVGGMFDDPGASRPYWLYYFVVDDIDGAAARVAANGGTVLREPQQVPTGDWIIHGRDPQGAMFALVGRRRQGRA